MHICKEKQSTARKAKGLPTFLLLNLSLTYPTCILLFLLLAGCATPYDKGVDVWEQGRHRLLGGHQSTLMSCAGQPMEVKRNGENSELIYGHKVTLDTANFYCLATFAVENNVITKITKVSANPGGLRDGTGACGLIVDKCVGSGALALEMAQMPLVRSVDRLDGPATQALAEAKSEGAIARKQGVEEVLYLGSKAAEQRAQSRSGTVSLPPVAQLPVIPVEQSSRASENSTGHASINKSIGYEKDTRGGRGQRQKTNVPGHSACISVHWGSQYSSGGKKYSHYALSNDCAMPLAVHYCTGSRCSTATGRYDLMSGQRIASSAMFSSMAHLSKSFRPAL